MRRLSLAWLVVLAASGTSAAQSLNVPASVIRVDVTPAARIAVEPASRPGATTTPLAKRILDDSRADDPASVSSQILDRLPIGRLQHLLKKNLALRVVEAAVGATLVGYQWRQADADSPIAQAGVHAIRFGGSQWLERSRFRVEPQVRRGGFAIYVKKNN